MNEWKSRIEPAAAEGFTDHTAANISQAISLKRIADHLEKRQASWSAIEPAELGVCEPDPNLKRIADHLEKQDTLALRCQELQEIATREIERRREVELHCRRVEDTLHAAWQGLLPPREVTITPEGRIHYAEPEDDMPDTSVGQMAAVCAVSGGTMILDVDTHTDGSQEAHAVATWEDDLAEREAEVSGTLTGEPTWDEGDDGAVQRSRR